MNYQKTVVNTFAPDVVITYVKVQCEQAIERCKQTGTPGFMTVWWAGISRSRVWHFSHRDQAPESIKHLRIGINQGHGILYGIRIEDRSTSGNPVETYQTGALCKNKAQIDYRCNILIHYHFSSIHNGCTQKCFVYASYVYVRGLHSTSLSIYCTTQGAHRYLHLDVWGGGILWEWECHTG